jgi:hypothetical protein
LVVVKDLTRTSSSEEIEKQMGELELGVSEALGISLLEVRDWYFQDSGNDEDWDWDLGGEREREWWLEEWVRERQLEYLSYWEDTYLRM